jgi:glutamine synthetase
MIILMCCVPAIASAPNDHRLGANEAPPAIISVFIGEYLTRVLNDIETRVGDKFDEQDEAILKLDLHRSIPELLLDNTDRNRTSPFAFTGTNLSSAPLVRLPTVLTR